MEIFTKRYSEFRRWTQAFALFVVALTFAGLVGGCASGNWTWKDGLTFALEAATLKVERTTSFVQAGRKEGADRTLSQARRALSDMATAQTLIAECEAVKCNVQALSQRLSLAALDRWEMSLREAGDINQADAAAAVRIALQLARKPGTGEQVEGNVTLGDFKALVERFRAATDRLAAALAT